MGWKVSGSVQRTRNAVTVALQLAVIKADARLLDHSVQGDPEFRGDCYTPKGFVWNHNGKHVISMNWPARMEGRQEMTDRINEGLRGCPVDECLYCEG